MMNIDSEDFSLNYGLHVTLLSWVCLFLSSRLVSQRICHKDEGRCTHQFSSLLRVLPKVSYAQLGRIDENARGYIH